MNEIDSRRGLTHLCKFRRLDGQQPRTGSNSGLDRALERAMGMATELAAVAVHRERHGRLIEPARPNRNYPKDLP